MNICIGVLAAGGKTSKCEILDSCLTLATLLMTPKLDCQKPRCWLSEVFFVDSSLSPKSMLQNHLKIKHQKIGNTWTFHDGVLLRATGLYGDAADTEPAHWFALDAGQHDMVRLHQERVGLIVLVETQRRRYPRKGVVRDRARAGYYTPSLAVTTAAI